MKYDTIVLNWNFKIQAKFFNLKMNYIFGICVNCEILICQFTLYFIVLFDQVVLKTTCVWKTLHVLIFWLSLQTPLHLSVVPGSSIPPVSCNDSMYTTLFSVKTPQFHFYDLQFKVNVTNTYREKASALQIKNLSILSMGKNIKCVNMTSTIQSTPNSWTAHLHVWNFGTPYKQTTSSADDEMVLQVDFLPDKSTIHLKDTFSIWSEIDCIYNGLLSSSYQTSTTVYLGSEINEV